MSVFTLSILIYSVDMKTRSLTDLDSGLKLNGRPYLLKQKKIALVLFLHLF